MAEGNEVLFQICVNDNVVSLEYHGGEYDMVVASALCQLFNREPKLLVTVLDMLSDDEFREKMNEATVDASDLFEMFNNKDKGKE